jgi:glycosyltransferase involved in cell wall biosynthesis
MNRVLYVSASDLYGGAARASYRTYSCLVDYGQQLGFEVGLRVNGSIGSDPSVRSGPPHGIPTQWLNLRLLLNRLYRTRFRPSNQTLHSTAWLPSGYLSELNANSQGYHLLHLHWLGDWMLSIEEIGELALPVVWTMHDQWAFLGSEHYTNPAQPSEPSHCINRYQHSYHKSCRPSYEQGPDVNRRTWLRKRRSWRKPMNIICPSRWMAECAQNSSLMHDWNIQVIPYPIDLASWAPADRRIARQLLNLPLDSLLILFGATGGASDPRKGGNLLFEALRILAGRPMFSSMDSVQLIVFGEHRPLNPPEIGFPIHYEGTVADQLRLRLLYSAADIFLLPSYQDNLPNTGLEAHACGLPIVAFQSTGLLDIVEHQVTGLLAEAFDPASFALAIETLLLDPSKRAQMGIAARQRAERLWSPSRIAAMHAEFYHSVLIND